MSRPPATLASLLALAPVLTSGCAADQTSQVTTFNLGLAFGYVEEASGRVDPIIAALKEADQDVVCLEELWTNQDDTGAWTTDVIDRVLSGVEAIYPYNYWMRTTVPADAPETGCEIAEADTLLACAQPACGDEPPENLADCVLANCADEFNATSPMCQSCLASNLGQPLDSIITACRGVSKGGIVYDGHNGLALLSKRQLGKTEMLEFDYALTARVALHAVVNLPGVGTSDVYCTHLAADLSSSIAYPPGGTYDSFAAENGGQTQALLDWVKTSQKTGNVVVLGDFDHGPARGSFAAEIPDAQKLVIDGGYLDPVSELDPPRCTFCDANLLQKGSGDGGSIIDHVYLPGGPAATDTEVVFTEPVKITGADGMPKMVNLSDHYGLRVTLGGG